MSSFLLMIGHAPSEDWEQVALVRNRHTGELAVLVNGDAEATPTAPAPRVLPPGEGGGTGSDAHPVPAADQAPTAVVDQAVALAGPNGVTVPAQQEGAPAPAVAPAGPGARRGPGRPARQ